MILWKLLLKKQKVVEQMQKSEHLLLLDRWLVQLKKKRNSNL